MTEIAAQLSEIEERIATACQKGGLGGEVPQLVAVTKTFPAEAVEEAIAVGHRCFGESRLQEAEPKLQALPDGLEWHFIGRVQRNKVRKILPLFPYIHAVDSMRLARYMDRIAGELGLKPKIFLQVNQAGEQSKGGFDEAGLREEMAELAALPNLSIMGLMTIPPAADTAEESRHWFRALRELRDQLETDFSIKLPALSMGMSGDYEIAAEEGATHIRVGSAIFGKRSYPAQAETS